MSLAYPPLRHYQILRQIGSGGTGMTYLARDTRTPRDVAVKIIRVDDAFRESEALARRLEQRFDEHMQAVARLVHPRIAPVLDFGLERDQSALYAFLTLPHYPAGSLADWLSQIRQRTLFPPALIFGFISQAAEALHYAHECGVLHQDIKPTNFLLRAPFAQPAGFPDLLLTDFGIAPFFAANSSRGLSQSNYVRGTSAYLAPEKWQGRALPASDQYALAILAFYLLTGTLPFQGTPGQMIYQHQGVQPPAPSRLNPQLAPTIDKIFERALAKDPAMRFPSVRAFGQEFARFQVIAGGQPGFQPPINSPLPPNRLPPLLPAQRPIQQLPPGPAAPLAMPPAYPVPGPRAVPPFPVNPYASMANPPQAANAPVPRPVFQEPVTKQPAPAASVAQVPPIETPRTDVRKQAPDDADPEATLIGRPSHSHAEAEPDAAPVPDPASATKDQPSFTDADSATTSSPAPTSAPKEQISLANADPEATLITRPSPPPAHTDDIGVDTAKQPVVQPAAPTPNGVSHVENASHPAQTLHAPAPPPLPETGAPPMNPQPRNASAPGLPPAPPGPPIQPPAAPPGPPIQPPPAPRRNIFQTGKTLLLLLLLVLVALAGGGTFLFKNIASAQNTGGADLPSATPRQQGAATSVEHVVNPYAGAQGFLSPNWVSRVKAGAKQVGGTLGEQETRVAQYSTAVWLTSIASVTGGTNGSKGLTGLLEAAEKQAASSRLPIVVTLVLADLPDRNCANPKANNELHINKGGLLKYESSYIDVIANTLKQTRYRNLRVAVIIEPGVLATVATDLKIASCLAASSTYALGIQYALNRLHALPNVYNYLDIAHPDWLGWSDKFNFTVSLMSTIVKGTTAGFKSIDGFASNIGNYIPTSEPYLTANQLIGGKPVRSATFYLGNPYIDMLSYDRAMRQALIASGFPESIGMLIDTSRNGWGGPDRPAGPSASKNLNTFVNASRIDRRVKRSNWCNQPGGIGARPQANPVDGIAAFVWITLPGVSDGTGTLIPKGKQNPSGQQPNSMCVPGNGQNGQPSTGAMPDAPISGAWFQAAFNTLVQNAYPPL